MEELDVVHQISSDKLNDQYYFQSLIEQAGLCGMVSDMEMTKLQADLLEILAEQTDKWCRGESSSIPSEKAQEIMNSIVFVIGMNLKSYETPGQAVELLKAESLKQIFEGGLKLVKRKMLICRHIQSRIMHNIFDTSNVYYQSTIKDGINGFYKLYRPQFGAHEIHITADYPVYMGRPQLNGIEFIEQYLRCIEVENEFCKYFAPKDVHHLLCGLTQDYRSVPMNIFEYVLLCALGLVLLNRNPHRLDLSRKDVESLYFLFSNKSDEEIKIYLEKSVIILEQHDLLSQAIRQYIEINLQKLVFTISNAVKTETLDKVFLVPSYPEQQMKISFDYGEQMDNRKYQKLVDKILWTDSSEEKIRIILNEVHSLADLLDILSDTELYEEEYDLLVNTLPLSVFAILLSRFPNKDFLERESEKFLYEALVKRKQTLSFEEMKQVERALEAIQTSL